MRLLPYRSFKTVVFSTFPPSKAKCAKVSWDVFLLNRFRKCEKDCHWRVFPRKKTLMSCYPGQDVKLIRCCPQYDAKLMWRHRANNIVSVAAICAAAHLIFFWSYPTCCVASLRVRPVGCISYNMYIIIVNAPLVTFFRCKWRLKWHVDNVM